MDDARVREVRITRIFDAPRELVWAAWTEAEQLAKWFMPHGFTVPECEVDLRPGGAKRLVARGPDGSEMPLGGEFREIVPPERLVFTETAFEGPDGEPMIETLNTATFTDRGDKTELTFHAVVTRVSSEMAGPMAGMEEGWIQSFEKLDAFLTGREADSSEREIATTRVLDAPRDVVWRAWTGPEQVVQWWGPKGFTTTIEEMDVRPGGVWRHTMHGPDGTDYPNRVVFLEVREPGCLAYLHGEPGEPDHFFATVLFDDEGGKTRLSMRSLFPSEADRDRVAEGYGAVEGMESTIDELAAFLAARS